MKVNQLIATDIQTRGSVVPIITWKCAVDTKKTTVITPIGRYAVIYRYPSESTTYVTQGLYWNNREDHYIGKDELEGEGFSFDRFYFDGYEDPDQKIILCVVEENILQRFLSQPKVHLQLMHMC